MDDQFNLIPEIEKRFQDLKPIFTTSFETQAIDTLNRHNMQYLIFTPFAREKFQNNNFNFLDAKCFKRINDEEREIKTYKSKCTLDKDEN